MFHLLIFPIFRMISQTCFIYFNLLLYQRKYLFVSCQSEMLSWINFPIVSNVLMTCKDKSHFHIFRSWEGSLFRASLTKIMEINFLVVRIHRSLKNLIFKKLIMQLVKAFWWLIKCFFPKKVFSQPGNNISLVYVWKLYRFSVEFPFFHYWKLYL